MDSIEALFDADRVLVLGIGGSGDVVGTIPTAELLRMHGVEVIVGGLAWERSANVERPGPTPFDRIEYLDRISATVGRASPETQTAQGCRFSESHVAQHYDAETLLVDVTRGVPAMVDGLDAACAELDVDVVVGTDSGGDALAEGTEPGVLSPLADGLSLVALEELERETALGVFGYGSDGELAPAAMDERFAAVASRGGVLGAWGLTPRIVARMQEVLEVVPTDASRVPVEAFHGAMGDRTIRDGTRPVHMSPASIITFYLAPAAVAEGSTIADAIRGTETLEAADRALREVGIGTELPESYY